MLNDMQLVYMFGESLSTAETSAIVDMRGYGRAGLYSPRLVVSLADTPVGGTSVQFALQSSDTLDFAAPVVEYTSPVYDTTVITAPKILAQIVPPHIMRRFTRIVLTKGGQFTGGKINAFITASEDFPMRALEDEIEGV